MDDWDEMGRGAIFRVTAASEVELIEVEELADPPEPRTALGLQVDEADVDAIYSRLEGAGARLKAPPRVPRVADAVIRRFGSERCARERLRAGARQRAVGSRWRAAKVSAAPGRGAAW